jgi:hypothetical protein
MKRLLFALVFTSRAPLGLDVEITEQELKRDLLEDSFLYKAVWILMGHFCGGRVRARRTLNFISRHSP